MDYSTPHWLSDSFDVTKATKWDLRRWMALYDQPLPANDVKLAELRRLFLDNVYANRRTLIKTFHTAPVLSEASSPIPSVTPERVSSVQIDRRNNPAAAAALASGMISAKPPREHADTPSASAAARRRKEHQQPPVQQQEPPVPAFTPPVFNRSKILFAMPTEESSSSSSSSPSSRRTAKPPSQQQRQQQQRQEASTSSNSHRNTAYASSSSSSFRPSTRYDSSTTANNDQAFSRRTIRPSQPSVATHPEDLSITPTRPTFTTAAKIDSPPSPPSPPAWTPQLGALTTAQALSSRPTTIAAPRPIPSASTLSPAIQFQARGAPQSRIKSTKKPFKRSRTDALCSRLGLLLPTLVVAVAAAWIYVRATLPYCPTSPRTRLPTHYHPHHHAWRTHLAGGLTCHPCPAHARCDAHGVLVGCKDQESILQTRGWSLAAGGRQFACVPDDQLRANVDRVVQSVLGALRDVAGRAECVSESGGDAAGNATGGAWVDRKAVRETYIPLALKQLAGGVPPAQLAVYADRALALVFSDPELAGDLARAWVHDDMYALEDDLDRVRSLRPEFPATCRMRRALRAAVNEYWRQALGVLVAGVAAAAWRARYLRSLYLREMAANLTAEIMELLARQQDGGVLGLRAVHTKYRREYVDKQGRVSAGEWVAVWYEVEVELERDPNVRRVCVKHRGEVVEGWEWIGFEALT